MKNPSAITQTAGSIIVTVRVQPRSSRNLLAMTAEGEIRVYLNAPPVDGAANQACVELFAKLLRLPKSKITLLSGLKSRNKVFELQGVSRDSFLAAIQVVGDKN